MKQAEALDLESALPVAAPARGRHHCTLTGFLATPRPQYKTTVSVYHIH